MNLLFIILLLSSYVNPFIGTDYTGHTFPGASVPFGLVQPGPQTGNMDWEHCSGYNYKDSAIQGFTQTHLNGTGCCDLGDILIMPFGNEKEADYSCAFSKKNEFASPGYYSVTLDNKTKVQISCSEHVSLYQFDYPGDRNLYMDFQNGTVRKETSLHKHVKDCQINVEDSCTLSGHMRLSLWVRDRELYFVIKFSEPFIQSRSWIADPNNKAPKYTFGFGKSGKPLKVKVSLSSRSVEGAENNMAAEIPAWDFDKVRKTAEGKWNDVLSIASAKGTKEQKTSFYTSVYHLFLQPNLISDNGEAPEYSTFSLWDTFRAAHPFYSLFIPERNADFVNSMLGQYDRQGFLPIWALWGGETYCMIGNHAVPVIVDAVLSGAKVDTAKAYEAIRRSLTENHKRSDWDVYDKFGYYPFDIIKKESASKTVESCYDDWCAYLLAAKLGKSQDAEFFKNRSQYYRNLFDTKTGFIRGRDSLGSWRTPFSPFVLAKNGPLGDDYTEGNAWQYSWHCLHDVEGLMQLMGGKERFVSKLDSLFSLTSDVSVTGKVSDVTGLIGQYAHGNEPSHHIAYFYTLAGEHNKTAEVVRNVFDRFYLAKPDGLCGNDDCGQMSAWYLFSSFGFYPVDPVSGEYVLGAPQLPEVRLSLPGGKHLTIIAKNVSKDNKYVSEVTLNGNPISKTISRKDILSGGELVFKMTNINKK